MGIAVGSRGEVQGRNRLGQVTPL